MRINDDTRPGPWRVCAACRTRRPAAELIRFACRGACVVVDLARREPGRGLHLCASSACLSRAVKKKIFRRNLRAAVEVAVEPLREAIVTALEEALRRALRDGRRSGWVSDPEGSAVRPPERVRAM